jgi:hypothetical protein
LRVVFLAVLRVVCLAVCRAAFRFVTRVAAARVDLDVPFAGALGFTFFVAIDGHLPSVRRWSECDEHVPGVL